MKARKTRVRRARASGNNRPGNKKVRKEIQNFLRALDSYAECFSAHPEISFEQHHGSVVQAADNLLRHASSDRRPSRGRT